LSEVVASKLGWGWILLEPAIYITLYSVLRGAMARGGHVLSTQSLHPVVFAGVGIVLFQLWMRGFIRQLNAVRNNAALIQGVDWPVETIFLAELVRGAFEYAIRLPLLALLVLAFQRGVGLQAILAAFVGFFVVATGHALGFLLSPMGTLFVDLQKLVSSLSLAILLGSGVFFLPARTEGGLYWWVFALNPLASGLDTTRAFLLGQPLLLGGPFSLWVSALVVAAGVMARRIRHIRAVLVEHLP
jgi:lipopolysaccharide transport system permease protein